MNFNMNNSDICKVEVTSENLSPSPSNQQLSEGSLHRSERQDQRQSQHKYPLHYSSQSSQNSLIQSQHQYPLHSSSQSSQHPSIQSQSLVHSSSQITPLLSSTLSEVKSAQQSPQASRHPSSSTVSSMEEDSIKVVSIPEVESLIDD